MSSIKTLSILIIAAMLLSACGREGPFGNTPGPKKPEWLNHRYSGPSFQ